MNFQEVLQEIKDMKPITLPMIDDIKKMTPEEQREIFETIDKIIEQKKNIKNDILYNN
jgi:hypothetical protein